MGVVYAAFHGDTQVALKVIRPEYASDAQFRARFAREAALMSRVSGVCTAEVLGYDTDGAKPWLATRYVPGPTLQEYLTWRGPMSSSALTALAGGLAEALTAMHRVGVVHRDLKPSNVILSAAGPRVIDFGIATVAEGTTITRTHQFVGSTGWISPEQYKGVSPGEPADVFCFGALLVYAATGNPPFGGGAAEVVAHRVLTEDPDLSALAPQLRDLAEAALSKDPAQRPQAEQVAAALAGAGGLGDDASDATQVLTRVIGAGWSEVATALPGQTPWPRPRNARGEWILLSTAAALVTVGLAAAITYKLSAATTSPAAGSAALPPVRTTQSAAPAVAASGSPTSTTTLSSQSPILAAATPTTIWASLTVGTRHTLLFKPLHFKGWVPRGPNVKSPWLEPAAGAQYQNTDIDPGAMIYCAYSCYASPGSLTLDGAVHIDGLSMGTARMSGANDLTNNMLNAQVGGSFEVNAKITYTIKADGIPIISKVIETFTGG